jgi:hypothetical protein
MRPSDRPAAVPLRPRRALVAAALAVAWAAAAPAAPATATASPYTRGLNQAEAHLRMAIEVRPARLGEYLGSSETVCGLAEEAAARGDEAAAAADWSTLEQLVRDRGRPEAAAIDAAFGRADASLLTLRRRFSRAWRGQPERVRDLKGGVDQVRRGVSRLRRAIDAIAGSFASWEAHDCAGARARIRAGAERIPAGLVPVNQGIWRLWRLSAVASP